MTGTTVVGYVPQLPSVTSSIFARCFVHNIVVYFFAAPFLLIFPEFANFFFLGMNVVKKPQQPAV